MLRTALSTPKLGVYIHSPLPKKEKGNRGSQTSEQVIKDTDKIQGSTYLKKAGICL